MEEFGLMTPRNFQNKLRGFEERIEDEQFFTRQMYFNLLTSQGFKGKPYQLWRLPIDSHIIKEYETHTTKEELKYILGKYKKANPKLFRPKENIK